MYTPMNSHGLLTFPDTPYIQFCALYAVALAQVLL